jgi:hypothetical protein
LNVLDDVISELGQQAAFLVKQSISAIPPGDGNLGKGIIAQISISGWNRRF